MSTIQQLFEQAQLAEAAYANFASKDDESVKLALKNTKEDNHFSAKQADEFVKNWKVISQMPDTGSGFSGTLFQNTTTKEYSFSLKGTAGFVDYAADVGDIVVDGIAMFQIVDMYNYWQSLTHTGTYQAKAMVLQPAMTTLLLAGGFVLGIPIEIYLQANGYLIDKPTNAVYKIETVSSSTLSDARLRVGSGLLPSTAKVSVDGHSLGGHLAVAFSRLFPSATLSVTTVNAVGFRATNSNVNNLFTALGGAASFDVSKITAVVGSAGGNFVSQDTLLLGQPSAQSEIFTEIWLDTKLGHGSSQMTDSLAVYALFSKLDKSLQSGDATAMTTLSNLLKASSNVAENSLEAAVSALGKIFGTTTFSAVEAGRDSLYANIKTLLDDRRWCITKNFPTFPLV